MSACRPALWMLAALGCASPFQGGRSAPDTDNFGRLLARFVPSRCEDAAHAEREPRISLIELFETQTGRVVLVERRFGHDALVVDNAYDEGASRVFELSTKSGSVRKWVVPRSGGAPALLTVGAGELQRKKGHFEASVFEPVLSCALIPMETMIVTAAGAPTSAPNLAAPTPELDAGAESAADASTNAEP